MGGWGWGRTRPPPILRSEGTTLKNEKNNQSDILKQNSDTKSESLLKIKCENDLITPRQIIAPNDLIISRQIIAPITAINPKIKGGYSFVHVVSMVNHGFNEAQSQKHLGIKEHFSHENEK